jgi:hypothetical protein
MSYTASSAISASGKYVRSKRLMLMPVDVRHEIDAVCVPVKADFLRNLRMHVGAL